MMRVEVITYEIHSRNKGPIYLERAPEAHSWVIRENAEYWTRSGGTCVPLLSTPDHIAATRWTLREAIDEVQRRTGEVVEGHDDPLPIETTTPAQRAIAAIKACYARFIGDNDRNRGARVGLRVAEGAVTEALTGRPATSDSL